ncbi:MAG: rod shape-determining protein MreD [Acidimicrobiales bacterium]
MNPDNPWPRLALVVSAVFVLHEAVLHGLRVDGVRPDLMLGLALVAGIVAGPEVGAVAGFAGGTLTDLFVNTPFGLSGLVACVTAYALGRVHQTFGPGPGWSVPFLVAVASAVAVATWAVLGTVLGLRGLLHPHLAVVVMAVSTVNAGASLPFARLVRWGLGHAPKRIAA